MNLTLLGINHRTAPVEVREKMNIPADAPARRPWPTSCIAKASAKAMILSTCNRVEVTTSAERRSGCGIHHSRISGGPSPLRLESFAHFFYRLRQQEVVKHLFRVASSLDSMILGEPQILGQVKQAYCDGARQRAR